MGRQLITIGRSHPLSELRDSMFDTAWKCKCCFPLWLDWDDTEGLFVCETGGSRLRKESEVSSKGFIVY